MTSDNHTLISNDDLWVLFDSIEQLRNTGMTCKAFKDILQPSVNLHPLIYLVFQEVDEQTEELKDFICQLKRNTQPQVE